MSSTPMPLQIQAFDNGTPRVLDALMVLAAAAEMLPVPKSTIAAIDSIRSVQRTWTYPGDGGTLAAGQKIFAIPGGYTVGFVDVFLGPLRLSDYTATDGATVTINFPTLSVDDVLSVAVLKTSTIANAATKVDLAAKASIGHTTVFDVDFAVAATDVQIGFQTLTAARTLTLPDVDTYPIGQVLFVADESGQCSVDRPITIVVGPGTGDSIAGQASIRLTDPYNGIGFRRGAANLWIITR